MTKNNECEEGESNYIQELRDREISMHWPSNILKPFAVQNILLVHSVLVFILCLLVLVLFILRNRQRY